MEIKTLSENGLNFIAREEGCILKPYLDPVGIPTIGIGQTYYPATGKKVTMKDPPITLAQAKSMFRQMVKNYELGVYSVTRDDINQNQFDALVSMCYNIGTGAFKGSTLLRKVNANPKDKTIAQAFENWSYAGDGTKDRKDNDKDGLIDEPGEKKDILRGRRQREAKLYFS